MICWTVQEHFQSKQGNTITNCYFEKGVICFEKTFNIPNRESLKCNCSLSVSGKVRSFNINLSEGNIQKPEWRHSPFWEKFSNGKLQNEIKLSGVTNDGIIFMALHTKALIPSKGTSEIKVGIAVNPVQTIATYNIISLMEKYNPTEICQMSWNDYFTQVPEFFCSDEFINRYYWYRWYGLKLNTIYGGELNYLYPSVAEGIGYFRAPITYSAQCHMLENRWLNEPELARGSLSMFIANQRNDEIGRAHV